MFEYSHSVAEKQVNCTQVSYVASVLLMCESNRRAAGSVLSPRLLSEQRQVVFYDGLYVVAL